MEHIRTDHPSINIILSYQNPKHNNRQQKDSHMRAHSSCRWRLRWRTGRCVRCSFLCWTSIVAEAGPDDSVDAFARQDINVLAVVLTEGVYVAK
uniref:Uncharacterized protein n=1 Tax=Arundo donax TaxID=35708 RepID=A0A0A9GE14_ARUDO